MKIAYFDCFSGISGDMVLGALVDSGADLRQIEESLRQLAPEVLQLAEALLSLDALGDHAEPETNAKAEHRVGKSD